MSMECGECERDRRGPHDPTCSRHPDNRPMTTETPKPKTKTKYLLVVKIETDNPHHDPDFLKHLILDTLKSNGLKCSVHTYPAQVYPADIPTQ